MENLAFKVIPLPETAITRVKRERARAPGIFDRREGGFVFPLEARAPGNTGSGFTEVKEEGGTKKPSTAGAAGGGGLRLKPTIGAHEDINASVQGLIDEGKLWFAYTHNFLNQMNNGFRESAFVTIAEKAIAKGKMRLARWSTAQVRLKSTRDSLRAKISVKYLSDGKYIRAARMGHKVRGGIGIFDRQAGTRKALIYSALHGLATSGSRFKRMLAWYVLFRRGDLAMILASLNPFMRRGIRDTQRLGGWVRAHAEEMDED